MESNQDQVDTILDRIQKGSSTQALSEGLNILAKLIANIVSNPFEQKYRHVKITNKTIQSKVMSLPQIKNLLKQLGYTLESQEMYTLKDQQVGDFLEGAPAIQYRKRLVSAKLESPQAYEKERLIVKQHKQKNAERLAKQKQTRRLKEKCQMDKQQRKHMKVDESKSNELKFGTKQTTWSDIGVDLSKKKGG